MRTAIIMLSCCDYESLEISLACHSAYFPKDIPFYILQNCRGTYDSERSFEAAKRIARLFPGTVKVIDWIAPTQPYYAIRALLASEDFKEIDFVCKVDDDVFPLTEGWLDVLSQTYLSAESAEERPLAYTTPLINNNVWGFPETIKVLGLQEEYFNSVAYDHLVGNGAHDAPLEIKSRNEIATGTNGTIWGSPHIARWLHERTTFMPDVFIERTTHLSPETIPYADRYSIGCIFFRKNLWELFDSGGFDDEGMLQDYCRRTQARILCARSAPFVHLSYFSQREENRDLISKARDFYQKRLKHPFPISLHSDRLIEIECRLRWLEGQRNFANPPVVAETNSQVFVDAESVIPVNSDEITINPQDRPESSRLSKTNSGYDHGALIAERQRLVSRHPHLFPKIVFFGLHPRLDHMFELYGLDNFKNIAICDNRNQSEQMEFRGRRIRSVDDISLLDMDALIITEDPARENSISTENMLISKGIPAEKILRVSQPGSIHRALTNALGTPKDRQKDICHLSIRQNLFPWGHYAYCLIIAAETAIKTGLKKFTAIEFGVRQGTGLTTLREIADFIHQTLDIEVNVIGFDRETAEAVSIDHHPGSGLAALAPLARPDDPELQKSLPDNGALVLGDLENGLAETMEKIDLDCPIGFVSINMCQHYSILSCLKLLEISVEKLLPVIPVWVNDSYLSVLHSLGAGETLAIREFNKTHLHRKIEQKTVRSDHYPRLWHHCIWFAHIFDHGARQGKTDVNFDVFI